MMFLHDWLWLKLLLWSYDKDYALSPRLPQKWKWPCVLRTPTRDANALQSDDNQPQGQDKYLLLTTRKLLALPRWNQIL